MIVGEEKKVTYATLAAGQTGEFHRQFDAAIEQVRANLGRHYPNFIGGEPAYSSAGEFEKHNPANTREVLGHFQKGTREDARRAIAAANAAFQVWGNLSWRDRVASLRRVAEGLEQRKFEIATAMVMEVGKNRLEAMGDVEEGIDLIRYYCERMEANEGFERPMSRFTENEKTFSVLRPYGVWAVISPFNFPMALAIGPASGALVAGNAVVFKPATDTPWVGYLLAETMIDSGLPKGTFNFVAGPGSTVGEELVQNPGINGLVFTGSYEVGFNIFKRFSQNYPKPCITEMGGKNPAIVTHHADLDKATDGIMRAAFGLDGQKCSACSRVYVERGMKDQFLDLLVEKTRKLKIGDPLDRTVFMGPVINRNAQEKFHHYVEMAKRDGRIVYGGGIPAGSDYEHGYFVEPTIVDGLPKDHEMFQEELFVPIVCVAEVDSLDEALTLANQTQYGLTAGLYSEDQAEIDRFLNTIQAGVVYINRRAGATTGAWPGIQPFGGWKASGSTGRNGGGLYYIQQFMREQSRTIVE
jgi:1-pyrroline-5-carboxylate dehydrogenase